MQEMQFHSWVMKIPWRRKWQPVPVFLPGKSHGQRSLAGYSPWRHKSDTTESLWAHARTLTYTYTHAIPNSNQCMFCFLYYLIPPRNYNFRIPSRNYHNKLLCYYLLSQNREDFRTLESTFIPLSNHCTLSPLQTKPSSWVLRQSLSRFFIIA